MVAHRRAPEPVTLSLSEERSIAAAARADVRSVRRVARGEVLRGIVHDRVVVAIAAVLRERQGDR